jgi:hypothetical protein
MTDGVDGVTNVGCGVGSALISKLTVVIVNNLGGWCLLLIPVWLWGWTITSDGEYARLRELDCDVLETYAARSSPRGYWGRPGFALVHFDFLGGVLINFESHSEA